MIEGSYYRMLVATVVVIVVIASAIMSYVIVVRPLEYTVDALQKTYVEVSHRTDTEIDEGVNNTFSAIPYFLAAGIVFFVILVMVWYFAYAHKNEYERD